MPLFRRRAMVNRKSDGTYSIDFPDHIRELLVGLSRQLDNALDGDDDPSLARLFPTAYANDPERDAGYQVFARGELIEHRREAIVLLTETSEKESLNEDELMAWMHVVNDVRLVLGTVLDVSEDSESVEPDHPQADLHDLYHLLGAVLAEIVNGLSDGLPDDAELDNEMPPDLEPTTINDIDSLNIEPTDLTDGNDGDSSDKPPSD